MKVQGIRSVFYEMEIDFKSWCTKIETGLLTYICIVQTQFEKEIKIVCVVGLGIQLCNLAYYIYIYIFSFSQVNRQFHTSYIVSIQKEREREGKLGNSNLHQLDSSTYLFHYCNNRQLHYAYSIVELNLTLHTHARVHACA